MDITGIITSMQAVVKIASSQYIVSPGLEILIDKQAQKDGKLVFNQVYLLIDGDDVRVGKPFVPDTEVHATILKHTQGKKLKISRFKAKSRYDKSIGFRPKYTQVKIDSITTNQIQVQNGPSVKKPSPKTAVRKTRETKS